MPREVYSASSLEPIFPDCNLGERFVTVAKGLHLVGDQIKMFPAFVKWRPVFLQGVLSEFSEDELENLKTYYHIPLVLPPKDSPTFLDKTRKILPFLGDKPPKMVGVPVEKMIEIREILSLYLTNPEVEQEVLSTSVAGFLRKTAIGNSEKDRANDCLFQLLALGKEVEAIVVPHRLYGSDQALLKDFICLLICFACREGSISAFQVVYLEQLVNHFYLEPKWFCDTVSRCLSYDEQVRKDVSYNLLSKHGFMDMWEMITEELLFVENLRSSFRFGKDKLMLPQYVCKDKDKLLEIQGKVSGRIEVFGI